MIRGRRDGRVALVATLGVAVLLVAGCGEHQGPGTIEGSRRPEALVAEREAAQQRAAERMARAATSPRPEKQILFGDLHVHTTFSADAFLMALPLMQGEGMSPVANACDYARHCSALDFWSINDHAESLTPRRWSETQDAIRQCNAVAGDPANPDVVAFLGWEWTQMGATPDEHWGHKNVVLREWEEGRVPTRPIHSAAGSYATSAMRRRPPLLDMLRLPLSDWENRQIYFDLGLFQREITQAPACPEGVDVRELPADCTEGASTPGVLFEKLRQWGLDALVIPHGTAWGIYTPPGASWEKQLDPAQHDPALQRLIEVYSGHGNSEEYRDWRAVSRDAAGDLACPAPRDGYEACCWRAGELIRARCDDPESPRCDERVATARRHFVEAGVDGRLTVPGARQEEWGDCDSCPDCFLPAYRYRPGSSVQSIAALGKPDAAPGSRQFRFGFIGSSDNHSARPGTGYKEVHRLGSSDARGVRDPELVDLLNPQASEARSPESRPFDRATSELPPWQVLDYERPASFFMTGGLAAVHSRGRSRDAIWDAMQRGEVYGTSGPRILLWFDLLSGAEGSFPMGSQVTADASPRFRVRAVGSFVQQPGCPASAEQALTPERLERLCRSECYHPSDRRHPIERIEIVKITPRQSPDEATADLVSDPWRVFECPDDPDGCSIEFEDPAFAGTGRAALYYVRALQEPTPAINAGHLRCRARDADGLCTDVEPCYADWRLPADDDCLAPVRERAWSSPIYLQPAPGLARSRSGGTGS